MRCFVTGLVVSGCEAFAPGSAGAACRGAVAGFPVAGAGTPCAATAVAMTDAARNSNSFFMGDVPLAWSENC